MTDSSIINVVLRDTGYGDIACSVVYGFLRSHKYLVQLRLLPR